MPQETGAQYINRCRQLGFSDAEITQAMAGAGWEDADLHQAFTEANSLTTQVGPKKKGSKILPWVIGGVIVVFVIAAVLVGVYFAYATSL